MTGNSSLSAEDVDKKEEEYIGGKKFLSQTPLCAKYCRCSDYPAQLFLLLYTLPDKNRPQQHWGTLTISAQTLEAFHLRNCSQYGHESSERLGCDYRLPHLCFWNGAYLCAYLLLYKFAECVKCCKYTSFLIEHALLKPSAKPFLACKLVNVFYEMPLIRSSIVMNRMDAFLEILDFR